MAINTYEERKKKGLCTMCGGEIDLLGSTMCYACRQKNAKQTAWYRQRKALEAENIMARRPRAFHDPVHSLDEVGRMANERGISYGQMVAILEGRTTLRTTFHYGGVTKLS